MARRSRKNKLFGFLTDSKVTYHRDVAGERADLILAKREQDRKEALELRREELEQKKRKQRTQLAGYMGTRMYKTGSGEYMTSIDDSRFDSLSDAKAFVRSVKTNPRRRRNPEDAAASLSEAWHGRPAKEAVEYETPIHVHRFLTQLGRLNSLEILVSKNKTQTIEFDSETKLASNEEGTQLFVEGGDQSLDLEALGIDPAGKEAVVVGPVHAVTYTTAKHHLGKQDKTPGPYRHELGEEGGELPVLIYDTVNQIVSFAGGSYRIDRDMDFGQHSAGLRD